MDNLKVSESINNIAKQFLCCVPIKHFKWNNIFQHLTYDLQDTLLRKTVNFKLILKHPIQITYQRTFLKYLMENLEIQGAEIHDDLYSAYGRLVSLPSSTEHFKHYYIGKSGTIVSLKENANLISDGTTGLRTWQASLALSEWALENENHFKNRIILELGSGIGLTGLTIAMECSPSYIYLTDCHQSVLRTLCDNVALNIEDTGISVPNRSNILEASNLLKRLQNRCLYNNAINSNVFVLDLPWEDASEMECLKLGTINTVIAADVVYDSDLFEPLIKTVKSLATYCNVEEFIFCCTERNPQTIEAFINLIRDASFIVEELCIPNQKNFIWPTDTPIRIFSFQVEL